MWVRFVAYGASRVQQDRGDEWVELDPGPGGAWAWADPFEPSSSLADVLGDVLGLPDGPFVAADVDLLRAARELGRELALAASCDVAEAMPRIAAEAVALGFELWPLRVGQRRYVALVGPDEGRGVLVLRMAGGRTVLQAPHGFHDRHTQAIALSLMQESDALALQLNTRHRDRIEPAEAEAPPADLAARDDTWFHALMLGVLDAVEHPLVVQLHGFGRQTVEQPDVDLVISGGWQPRDSVVDTAAAELEGLGGVARFPDDLDVLGAQRNAQGRAVNIRPTSAFLHLELGPELREELEADAAARERLAAALARAAEEIGGLR